MHAPYLQVCSQHQITVLTFCAGHLASHKLTEGVTCKSNVGQAALGVSADRSVRFCVDCDSDWLCQCEVWCKWCSPGMQREQLHNRVLVKRVLSVRWEGYADSVTEDIKWMHYALNGLLRFVLISLLSRAQMINSSYGGYPKAISFM